LRLKADCKLFLSFPLKKGFKMVCLKKILFLDYDNACRSQMAEAYANKFGAGKIKAYSAGAYPARQVMLKAILVMREQGIDISCVKSKQYALMLLKTFDYVVTFGRECICPFLDTEAHIKLNVPDPGKMDINELRAVRDLIKEQVLKLVEYISRDKIDRRKRAQDKTVQINLFS